MASCGTVPARDATVQKRAHWDWGQEGNEWQRLNDRSILDSMKRWGKTKDDIFPYRYSYSPAALGGEITTSGLPVGAEATTHLLRRKYGLPRRSERHRHQAEA